jgi:drug/metabolite transporter (DMT)-like permease
MLMSITRNSVNLFKAIIAIRYIKTFAALINYRLLIGIFWKVLSCACFAGINIIVRYLSGSSLPIEQKLPGCVIIFFQNIIGTLLLLPFVYQKTKELNLYKSLVSSKYLPLQIARIVIAILGVLLWYASLAKMQVTQVVAISFLSPMLTFIGAVLLLKEKLDLKKLIAIILSLGGGFLISRPDLAIIDKLCNWEAIWPLSAALIFAADKLITKKILSQQECPQLTAIYLLLFTAPICLIFGLCNNSWVLPASSNFLPLLLLGILGATAHVAFNKSLETSDITLIMPYGISKIIFSSVFSYWFFAEIPEAFSIWLGIIIISLSTVLLM